MRVTDEPPWCLGQFRSKQGLNQAEKGEKKGYKKGQIRPRCEFDKVTGYTIEIDE